MKSMSIRNLRMKAVLSMVLILTFLSIVIQQTTYKRNGPSATRNSAESSLLTHSPNVGELRRKASLKARILNLGELRRKAPFKARDVPVMRATKMKFGPVYLFGASAGNTTDGMAWDVIKVYASILTTFYKSPNITCCLMYRSKNNTDIIQQPVSVTIPHWMRAKVSTFHFTCPNTRYLYGDIPNKVGLSLSELTCDEASVTYIKPLVPYKEAGIKLAIGTQVAYSNISAELIIEWMETYKYLGVDKIISYYYKNVNKQALTVLQYYHNSGFVDLYKFVPAGEDTMPRLFRKENGQLLNDLTMVVKESFERMSGYTYFGIIDFDEFLIPPKDRTIKEMLYHLNNTYKHAAGFVFKSKYYYTSWGKSGKTNDLLLGQYINHTSDPPKLDRKKQLYMPQYVSHGSVRTHVFIPVQGFNRITVPPREGFIRHFRKCRLTKTFNETVCLKNIDRVTDTSLAQWSMRIKDKVHQVRRKVFGTKIIKV